jgi:hypothetical protein
MHLNATHHPMAETSLRRKELSSPAPSWLGCGVARCSYLSWMVIFSIGKTSNLSPTLKKQLYEPDCSGMRTPRKAF